MTWYEPLIERRWLPDVVMRLAIRWLQLKRLLEEGRGGAEAAHERQRALIRLLRGSPLVVHAPRANEQHYEVPTEFFKYVLGHRMKYSGAYWPDGVHTLDHAEDAMLDLYCQRAELQDGQNILELGCGWGSLTLYAAERYPKSRILAVSNSRTQKACIESRGFPNVRVVTADMADFQPGDQYDRILSIEMFEHMRNYGVLFDRIASWLQPGGKLFVHIFAHHRYAYLFRFEDPSDWMARYFFAGGIMPSVPLLLYFCHPLQIEDQWVVDGRHYQRTAEAWLQNLDSHQASVMPILEATYGASRASAWFSKWRVFFMACAELFGFCGGRQWVVAHYRFVR